MGSHSRRDFLARSIAALGAANVLHAQDPPKGPTAHDQIREQAQNAPLQLQFNGKTAQEAREWQQKFDTQLRKLLGPHLPPKKWKTTLEKRVVLDDHVREELLLSAKGHPTLPIYLLIPKAKTDKPRAGIVALHGHGNYGYDPVAGRDDLPGVANAINNANYDYGRQLVREGFVVAAPCLVPFGRRVKRESYGKQDPCAVTFVRMQLLGKVLMAENLRDALWATELLAQHKMVDENRLGCVGLSYGGRMTMLTSALELRIKACVISGALNVMQERVQVRYSCGSQVIPGLLNYGDVPEISSLIAPRPCVWEVGSKDGLVKPEWAKEAITRISRAYRAFGAPQNLIVDNFTGGHRWNGKVGVPLLKKIL